MDVLLSKTRISVKNYLKLNCRIGLIEQSSASDVTGPDGSCFLAAWAVSMSFRNVRQKPNLPIWKGNSSPRCSARAYYSANAFSQGGAMCAWSGHTVNKFRRPAVLQLNIEDLTASKMNVLHHLAVQYEALIILLQKTHCTCVDKLTIPGFAQAGSF